MTTVLEHYYCTDSLQTTFNTTMATCI